MDKSDNRVEKANNFYHLKQYSAAIVLYESLANDGNYGAARRLGWMYVYGLGVERNMDQAIIWFEMAAHQNDLEAQFALGRVYLAKENYEKAWYYFEISSVQGFPPSLYRLGWICKYIYNDDVQAQFYWTQAGKLENIQACRDLGLHYLANSRSLSKKIYGMHLILKAVYISIRTALRDTQDVRFLY